MSRTETEIEGRRPAATKAAPSAAAGFFGLLKMLVVLAIVIAVGIVAWVMGAFSIFGLDSRSSDSQVITAIERTQEVSLLQLGIQGIKSKETNGDIGGVDIWFTDRTLFLQYEFNAKLGLDGSQVKVRKTGPHAFRISVPEFVFIGYSEPTFKVAVEDNGLLSWSTDDIDEAELITEILNDDARDTYLESNQDLLRGQTEQFYNQLVTSIDPKADTTFVYAE